jgi:hypothetical protein
MTAATLINATANGILAVSALHLVFRVFGHPESAIWNKPWAAVLCKAATTVTVCGALWNLLTLSSPAASEVMLNIGIAGNFVWLSFYQQYDRPSRPNNSRASGQVSGGNTPRRAANPRSRKKSPPARRD